ncbi:PAAR domain-containing protein [Amaricoccus sp.]|uniref:PAAR domain-containing protein n=1 Tax=Amaricoccus sp. TaxID=1872485 RepID=UPI0039E5A92E
MDGRRTPVPRSRRRTGSSLAAGSSTVFVNGLQLGRIGDPVACGSSVAAGSPDVFAGG